MENAAFKKPRVLEKFEMTMTDQKIHHANEMVFFFDRTLRAAKISPMVKYVNRRRLKVIFGSQWSDYNWQVNATGKLMQALERCGALFLLQGEVKIGRAHV